MTYVVKEIFYTLQGEGFHTGRPAVFCRFSGCNLWTGREDDRHRAVCKFCDTDFVGVGPDGGKFGTADELAGRVAAAWPAKSDGKRFVVCTGGEPLLQLDEPLVEAFHSHGFEIAVETNGTQLPPHGIDWICVSPKANAPLRLLNGDELKLVYPQVEPEAQPERFEGLAFRHFSLQPLDGPNLSANIRHTVDYCLAHPRWRLSLQTHKVLGLR
jgi:7-carboxy-7-deazaguanine synthase (Cx14CxxC type)